MGPSNYKSSALTTWPHVLPPYKRSEWVYEAVHPMDQRWKSYAMTDDKSEKRTRLFLSYPSWLRKWGRGQGTHLCYLFIHLYSLRIRPSPPVPCRYGHFAVLTSLLVKCPLRQGARVESCFRRLLTVHSEDSALLLSLLGSKCTNFFVCFIL